MKGPQLVLFKTVFIISKVKEKNQKIKTLFNKEGVICHEKTGYD